MAEKRPYFNASTAELEEIYKNNKKDIPTLKKLMRELEHRSRPKARALHEQITKSLALQNIDIASGDEEGSQQLSLYPLAGKNPAKRRKQKPTPESVQCQLEGICPESSKNDKKDPEDEQADKTQAKENQLESKKAENREAKERSAPDEAPIRRHNINLEKVVAATPEKAPVTKENFWRFLFRLLTGKK